MPKSRVWKVLIHRKAEKILRRLEGETLARLMAAIRKLGREPRPNGVQKLGGHENLYRIRVGDWRVIYAIEADELIVLVLEVSPRGGAYREI